MDFDQITLRNDSPLLIGLRIRDARTQRRLTPEQFATQTGVSKAHCATSSMAARIRRWSF